jgi:hypothetical protein
MVERNEKRELASLPIGDLAPRIVNSLRVSDSIPNELPPNTATTGSGLPVPRDSSSIGRQPSATDAGRSLTVPEAMRTNDPEAVDRAILASLPPSVASTLQPTFREFTDRYGWNEEFAGYHIPANVLVPRQDINTAKALVEQHLQPAPSPLIKQELARLRVSTKSRAESDDDLAMGFQVLAEECSEYPADVVVWALRSWARMETFYPSLAEIRERLQRGVQRRRAMAKALR